MGDSNELRALIRETSEQNAESCPGGAQVQDLTRQLREFVSVMGGTNGKGTDTAISSSSSRLNTTTRPEERLELRQTGGMVPSFHWTVEAATSFDALKTALSQAPVLQLPNFDDEFIVECDASGVGIGAVLQQSSHPIPFFSRKLADQHHKLAAYESELIGLAKAVVHWRPYLWGRQFLIRTDHYSLKYLLEQRLTTSPQQHWLSKLLGFDFRVEYKAGQQNIVVDALSQQDEEQCTSMAVLQPIMLLL
ncbi:hypothetical protein GH714_013267 [Hevea brasiliensis]|uniref:Reverse transcriptase/retrotransposon-derived protein RNase H-like domain-containing protein n=1 Tax=Hevea brasiliensis TaxID=3981 RepID=A0A6A6KIM5_HEVBR|nr:hypothetical protein GH714_013267 [Hevea brasiliensis]